jgi:hypothetical protein
MVKKIIKYILFFSFILLNVSLILKKVPKLIRLNLLFFNIDNKFILNENFTNS